MTADPDARPAGYASLAELRAVQARLGELRRKASETAALWDAAADFVRRGAATGVVLDSDDERWSVQGLPSQPDKMELIIFCCKLLCNLHKQIRSFMPV